MTEHRFDLICVSGLTPQIVTETLYALGTTDAADGLANLPAAVHVLTTTIGKNKIQQALLGLNGQFASLCRDYGWDAAAISFDADHIHVITDANGAPLDDIRDADDNAAAADFITAFIRNAANSAPRLHVSLAGGRKTMGYFTGYALSLYGRAADRLSHVLVNAPFESQRDFFYPPPQPQWLEVNGQPVSTADAIIELADIPFIRLRDGLDQNLLADALSFSESVARTQQLLDAPELHINLATREVWLQGHPLNLSNAPFLWLTWMATRKRDALDPLPFNEHAAIDLLRIVEQIEGSGASDLHDAVMEAKADAERGDKRYFERNRTRLNADLIQRCDIYPKAAERYQIKSFGKRPNTCYGLTLPPDSIHIEGDA